MSAADDFIDWFADRAMPWIVAVLIIAVVAAFLLLAGAAVQYLHTVATEGHVESGWIVEKSHTPAQTTYIKSGEVMLPVYTADSWEVTVCGPRAKSGRTDTESFSISEKAYQHTSTGTRWPMTEFP